MYRIAQVHRSGPRVGEPMPAVAGRQNAIEHVDAATHRFDQIERRADAHQVARLLLRKKRQRRIERGEHQLVPLAHRKPTDRIALEIHGHQRLCRAPPQRFVGAALHDAEQRLSRPRAPARPLRQERVPRPLGPAQRQLHRALDFFALGGELDALVELHLDVGAQQALDLDRSFRRQHVPRSVDVRLEHRAVLGDLPDLRQAHDLEAAGVRQDRFVPAHEGVQTAELGDPLRARPQHEVIGISEQNIGAGIANLFRIERLDGRDRPDRHERRRADDAARRHDFAAPRQAVAPERAIVKCRAVSHCSPCREWARLALVRRGRRDSECTRA